LEPHLQDILKEQNLYQQNEWQNKDYQVLNLVANYLHELKEKESGREVLQDLSAKAKQVNLSSQLNSLLARANANDIYQQN
jgi:hypothetical protein